MATSNSRDVRLGIEIETAGEDSIKRLAAAVRDLAREGDPAAAEYQRLANELERLSRQAGAVQSLQALRADVEALGKAQASAALAAEGASKAYEAQRQDADLLREKQAQLRAEVAQAKTAYDDLKLAYQTIRNAGRDAAQSQEAFAAKLREARQQTDEQNRALRAKRDSLKELNAEVRTAEQAEAALSREARRTAESARQAQQAFTAQSGALEDIQRTASTLGVDLERLDSAEQDLVATTRQYIAQVDILQALQKADSEAKRQAALEARALAEAQERGRAAAASELAAIADSERFIAEYNAEKRRAAQSALDFVLALEREEAAARGASAELDRLAAAARKANADAQYVADLTRLLSEQEDTTKRLAVAQREAALQTERLDQAMRDSAASIAAAEQAERRALDEFERAAKAASYTQFWNEQLDRLDTETAQAAAQQKRLADAAEAVSRAFGQTGVRSMQAIRAEIAQVNSAVGLLERQFKAGSIGADDLARASSSAQVRLATLRRELQTIPALPNAFEAINNSINGLISRFGSLTAAIATIGLAVRPVIEANVALDSLRRVLTNVTGSADLANAQIEFLRQTADKAGLSFGRIADSFSLFEASLVKAGVSLDTTQALFRGVASAAGDLGISSDRVGNILLALGQVANKGKVSLEELQGQIGEALPGALKLAADSLGITTAELQGLLKEGKLVSDDFLPAFAKQLNDTFGKGQEPVRGLAQAFNRVKNALTETSQQLADTSFYKALVTSLDSLATNFDKVVAGAAALTKGFLAFKAINIAQEFFGVKAAAEAAAIAKLRDVSATTASTAANVENSAVKQRGLAVDAEALTVTRAKTAAITQETLAISANTTARAANSAAGGAGALAALATGYDKVAVAATGAVSRIGGFVGALGGPYGLALTGAIAFSEQLGNGIAYVAAKMAGHIDTIERNEAAMRKDAEAARASAQAYAQREATITQSFVKVQVAFDKEIAAAENRVKVADKLLEAKKKEGEASVRLAELSGDEAAAKDAAARATGAVEVAVRNSLAAKQQELVLLEQERAALIEAAGAQETWSAARREFFAQFDQDLAKKKADLELLKQQAEAEGALADKAFLTAEAFKDNAAKVEFYSQQVAAAKENVEFLTKALAEGFTTQENVTQATRDLAVAQGLLKDAYKDATDEIKRRNQAMKEEADLSSKRTDLARREIEVALKIAEATGESADKYEAQLKLKRLDIQASEEKISASTREAQLLREEAALLQRKLDLNDPLYAQKKREIDSILNAAKAKELEGRIEQQNLKALNTELQLLDGTLKSATGNMASLGGAARSAAKDLDVFTDAARKARNASDLSVLGSNTYDKEGFATDANGNRINITGQIDIPEGYSLDTQAFLRAQQSAALSGLAAPDPRNFLVSDPGAIVRDPSSIYGPYTDQYNDGAGYSPFAPKKQGSSAGVATAASGTPVNININGQSSGTVTVASPADAVQLEKVLRALATGARSSGQGSGGY